jgi:hypothetical protein
VDECMVTCSPGVRMRGDRLEGDLTGWRARNIYQQSRRRRSSCVTRNACIKAAARGTSTDWSFISPGRMDTSSATHDAVVKV